jgi:hypothetical protein
VRPMIAHVKRVRTSVLFDLYVAGQLVNELVSREVERLGLKGPAQILLWHVALKAPVTPTELERETGLRPSTLRERMQPLFDGKMVRRSLWVTGRRSGASTPRRARSRPQCERAGASTSTGSCRTAAAFCSPTTPAAGSMRFPTRRGWRTSG